MSFGKQRRWAGWLAVVAVAMATNSAQAVPWKKISLVLDEFGIRNGIQRNYLGDGYDIRLSSQYDNRRFDFGLADLTLSGAARTDINLTRRLIPAADIRSATTVGVPMSYTFNINTGVQDITAVGRVSWNNNYSINALGFYDLDVSVSNRGTYETRGYGSNTTGLTDYDIGPINVSGNVFLDLLAIATQPLFEGSGQPNPFYKLSNQAGKSIVNAAETDAIRAKIAAGQILTDEEIDSIIATSLLASILGEQLPQFEGIPATLKLEDPAAKAAVEPKLAVVPEPATCLLLGLPLLVFWHPRRRGS